MDEFETDLHVPRGTSEQTLANQTADETWDLAPELARYVIQRPVTPICDSHAEVDPNDKSTESQEEEEISLIEIERRFRAMLQRTQQIAESEMVGQHLEERENLLSSTQGSIS